MINISINKFKKVLKSLAMLDAIIMPEWEYRYFSFDSQWGEYEEMASMKTGHGEEYYILFKGDSVIGKYYYPSYNHQIDLKDIPPCFNEFMNEVAFKMDDISNIFYRVSNNEEWVYLPNEFKCKYLFFDANEYKNWAEEYYETNLDIRSIEHIFSSQSINDEIVMNLNPDIVINDIVDDIIEINYPVVKE